MDGGTGQLPLGQGDAKPAPGLGQAQQILGADLVAESPGATDGMDASPLHRTGSGEFQKGVLA
ncbi:MAG: hypothetical protein ACYCUY_03105 [Acidithiobacillus sp.]